MARLNGTSMIVWLFLTIMFGLGNFHASAELQRFTHKAKNDGSLSFLVLGDWGRKGDYNQSDVAFQMGYIGEKLDIDFVISTGDNFYDNGLSSDRDPNFEESFSKIYTAKGLQKPWYAVLGNHDYRGDAEAQLSPFLRQIDSRWLCLRSYIVDSELVEIFFIDTTPFIQDYFISPNEHSYDWRGINNPPKAYVTKLLKNVAMALRGSKAKWKIAVGHHAIRSIGHHGDTRELVSLLLPVLQAHKVDFWINGHDHCLEHISDTASPMQFLVSGAGSKAWRGDVQKRNRKDVNFFYDGQGFMSVQLTQSDANVVFYDVNGNVLHRAMYSKELHSVETKDKLHSVI